MTTTPPPSEVPKPQEELVTTPVEEPEDVPTQEEIVLSQMVWGEARGCPKMHQAATVWVVLNRVEHGYGTIVEVVTAPSQFNGYDSSHPVDPEILKMVQEILRGEVQRVIPEDYMWFTGDGILNYFVNEWRGTDYWDWSLPDPYEGR